MYLNTLLLLIYTFRIGNAGSHNENDRSGVGLLNNEFDKLYNDIRNLHATYFTEYSRIREKVSLLEKMDSEIKLFKKTENAKITKNAMIQKLPAKVVVKTNDVLLDKYVPKRSLFSYEYESDQGDKILELEDKGYQLIIFKDYDKMLMSPEFRRPDLRPSTSSNARLSSIINENAIKKGFYNLDKLLGDEYQKRVFFLDEMKKQILEKSQNKQNNLKLFEQEYEEFIDTMIEEHQEMVDNMVDNSVVDQYDSYPTLEKDDIMCFHKCNPSLRVRKGEFKAYRRNILKSSNSRKSIDEIRTNKIGKSSTFPSNREKAMKNKSIFNYKNKLKSNKERRFLIGAILGTAITSIGTSIYSMHSAD